MITNSKPRKESDRTAQAHRLSGELKVQDVDQEIGLTLVGLGLEFERKEAAGLVTYAVCRQSTALGRLVIAPPNQIFTHVRVREYGAASGLNQEFETLCHHLRRDLEALCMMAKQAEVKENSRFSYPRPKRRQIVKEYRAARINGEVDNKETWAQNRYHICRKTLWRYECEFPETEAL